MDNANQIIPNLWLGNRNSPTEYANLKKNNIKLIINCTKDLNYWVPRDIHTVRLAINDANTEESNRILGEKMTELTFLMELYLKNNMGVLVHCWAGMQRSATVVICYLLKYKRYKLDEAKQIMKKERSIVFLPFPTFDDFINSYSKNV
jgi:protein-tyrosine phosphatase